MAAAPPDWRAAGFWLLSAVGAAVAFGLAGTWLPVAGGGASALSAGKIGHLLLMMAVPWGMARWLGRHFVVATAIALFCAMAALHAAQVPADASALKVLAAGGAASALGAFALSRQALHPAADSIASIAVPVSASMPGRPQAVMGLAVLAGLATGGMARFELMSLCGPTAGSTGAAPWVLSLSAVLAFGLCSIRAPIAWALALLYIARAAILAVLTTRDAAGVAAWAAQALLAIDCLTLPALMRLTGAQCGLSGAAGPGLAHHAGMVIGGALSTAPYFFGDAFTTLALSGSALSLLCVFCLLAWPRPLQTSRISSPLSP